MHQDIVNMDLWCMGMTPELNFNGAFSEGFKSHAIAMVTEWKQSNVQLGTGK